MNDEQLSTLLKHHAERHPASARLRAAVQTQITLHAAGRGPRIAGRFNSALQLGCSFLGGVLLTLVLVWLAPRLLTPDAVPQAVVQELLALHVRSMGTGSLYQVASSDRHTVKPWFQGKLDYAPEVPDLGDAGFQLLGGRIDKLHGRDVAALVYQLHKHYISAFVLPLGRVEAAELLQQRGFNIVHWSDGAMQTWAVTDADAVELERFVSAWQSRFSAGTPNEAK